MATRMSSSRTVPELKLRNPDFDKIMKKLKRDEELREKREREQPHKDFMKRAKGVGFSIRQSEFMWKWLAKIDHTHWDGRIGI